MTSTVRQRQGHGRVQLAGRGDSRLRRDQRALASRHRIHSVVLAHAVGSGTDLIGLLIRAPGDRAGDSPRDRRCSHIDAPHLVGRRW